LVQLQPDQLRKRITINSQKFVLADEVQVYPIDSESQSIRTIGLQQRQNNRKVNKLVRDWSDGLGYSRLRRDTDRGINGLRDADAETRFSAMLTLPLNPQTQIHEGTNNHLISYEHFKGNLYGFFESDYSDSAASQTTVSSFASASDTWTAAGSPVLGSSVSVEGSSANPSISFTVQSTSANRLLVVVAARGTPSAVLWNGASLTSLVLEGTLRVWYIVNPDTGAHSVTTTMGATEHQLAVMEFYGVNQSTPFGPVVKPGIVEATSIAINSVVTARNDIAFYATTTAGATGFNATGATEITDSSSSQVGLQTMWERATGTSASASSSWSFTYVAFAIGVAIKGAGGSIDLEETGAAGLRLFGTTVHKGSLFALGTKAGAEGQYEWRSSADAATWAGGAGGNWPTAVYVHTTETRKNDWSNKYADIMGFGTNIIVAIYEDPDSSGGSVPQVRIGYSPDSGANWTFHADLVIACTDTPNISLISARDIFSTFGATVPALVTSDNIYLLDIANDGYQAMLPEGILGGSAYEALAVSHASDASIYISKASGDILRIMVPSPGVIDLRNVGPHSRSKGVESDGLVSARQGHANFMWGGDPRWLFVSYGGHASGKNGSIFCFDYVTGAWHSFYKDGTENREMIRIIGSDEDDGVSRLHMATDQAAASIMQQFEEPYVSAGTGVTQQYRSTGYVEWAEDDLGDPHADSAVLSVRLDADDLDDVATIEGGSGTSTDVEIEYGVNGAAWDNVSTLGFFASDDATLFLGKTNQTTPGASEAGTPVGVSAKTFRMRAELKRDGTATNTPKIKEIQTEHVNKSEDLNGFIVKVDVGATALDQQINPEVVLDRIDTIKKTVTSIPLEFGQETDGTNTTYYVEHVRRGQFDSEGVLPQGVSYGAVTERTVNIGTVTMYLEERIDV
jgi:hypothetical protein